ncbi:hypothetical protein ACRRVB_02570 [Candidatus Cardinium hertigii]|uniref:hypothetical protein n=1 Tax=Candidatus Cardinium hertigii TaxID=247481 RepID=UPI003D7E1936
MICNNLIAIFVRFSIVSILYTCLYAGSCKNKTAANHTDCIVNKDEQKAHRTSNGLTTDPKEDEIASERKADRPPIFTLKEITIQAGKEQSILLAVTGDTEGYAIKSFSVKQNSSYHTKKFGIKLFKNQTIPPTGLSIPLTTDSNLKTGAYRLRIKLGQTGKGSKTTEQCVECTIHVIEDEVKNEPQNGSYSDGPPVQVSNNETLLENTSKNHSTQTDTPPAPLSFTEKNIVIQTGNKEPIALQVNGNTEGYIIDSISIKRNINKNKQYIHKPIASSGSINIGTLSFLNSGVHVLKMNISRGEENSDKQSIKCTIDVKP